MLERFFFDATLKTVALDFGNYDLKTFDGSGTPRAIRSIHRKLPRGVNALVGLAGAFEQKVAVIENLSPESSTGRDI